MPCRLHIDFCRLDKQHLTLLISAFLHNIDLHQHCLCAGISSEAIQRAYTIKMPRQRINEASRDLQQLSASGQERWRPSNYEATNLRGCLARANQRLRDNNLPPRARARRCPGVGPPRRDVCAEAGAEGGEASFYPRLLYILRILEIMDRYLSIPI